MATQDELSSLDAGVKLTSLPLDQMISTLGLGIAKAQQALDTNALETAVKLAETKLEFPGPADADGNPTTLSRSLLSLGFTPTFYHVTEASLELKIEMHMQVEDKIGGSLSASAKMDKGAVAVGGTISMEASRKFAADSSAMTHVSLRMISTPPPNEFLEYIRKVDGLPRLPATTTTTTTTPPPNDFGNDMSAPASNLSDDSSSTTTTTSSTDSSSSSSSSTDSSSSSSSSSDPAATTTPPATDPAASTTPPATDPAAATTPPATDPAAGSGTH